MGKTISLLIGNQPIRSLISLPISNLIGKLLIRRLIGNLLISILISRLRISH